MNGFREYLNYSEKYLTQMDSKDESCEQDWLLIPATILAWSAIESFVNNMLDDFSNLPRDLFELHERALLLEKRIKFNEDGTESGTFTLEGNDYKKLEDKILFLIAKFSQKEKAPIKGDSLWQKFQNFKNTRDDLIHPRRANEVILTKKLVEEYIGTSKKIISLLADKIWNRKIDF